MKLTLATAQLRGYAHPVHLRLDMWEMQCPLCDFAEPGKRRTVHRKKIEASNEARAHNAAVHPDALEEAWRKRAATSARRFHVKVPSLGRGYVDLGAHGRVPFRFAGRAA